MGKFRIEPHGRLEEWVADEAEVEDVKRYFRATRRAQRDIDLEPERYRHSFLKELPEKYHSLHSIRTSLKEEAR